MALRTTTISGDFKIWAPGMMKERFGHKVIHSLQKDNQHAEGNSDHHVRQSSGGILRMVDTPGKTWGYI